MLYWLTLIVILLLIVSFMKDNRSLLNPALLIIGLFFLYLSLADLFYQLDWLVVHNIVFAAGFVLLPLILFLSGFFLVYNGCILLRKEGYSKANLLSLAMGFAILLFFLLLFWRFTDQNGLFYRNSYLNIFVISIFFTYFLFGFAFAGFMLYSYLYLFIPKRKQYDFIIIHGAGLMNGEEVTPLLKKRIDKAVEAYQRLGNSKTRLIASGGQGEDEKISEAQAIANYLLKTGAVPSSAILLEDKSRTTFENLLFSKEIGESLCPQPQFLFVTNDYHVFRTSVYAKKIGLVGDGLGCATASYYIPSAFIREFIALCVRLKWLFIVLYLLYFISTVLAYRGILW